MCNNIYYVTCYILVYIHIMCSYTYIYYRKGVLKLTYRRELHNPVMATCSLEKQRTNSVHN